MTRERVSIGIVWLAAVVGVFGVAILADPSRHLVWVSILMLTLICLTCLLQLRLQESDGFIMRMSMSLVGALIILGVASLGFALLGGDAVVGTPNHS